MISVEHELVSEHPLYLVVIFILTIGIKLYFILKAAVLSMIFVVPIFRYSIFFDLLLLYITNATDNPNNPTLIDFNCST